MRILSEIAQLADIKKSLAGVKLSEISVEEAAKALSVLGFTNTEQVESFVRFAQAASLDPSETIMDFITNGGIARIFTNRQSQDSGPVIVQCVHCGELNFL